MPAEGVSFYEQAVAIALQNSTLTSEDKDTLIDLCSDVGEFFSSVENYHKAIYYYNIGLAAVADRDPTDPRGEELLKERVACEQRLKGPAATSAYQPAGVNIVQWSDNPGSVEDEGKALLP